MSDPFDWFKKQADPIFEVSEKVRRIEPEIVNEFGFWSLIKLVALVYFANIYSPIIYSKKDDWVRNMNYIELFSGSGLCRIKDTGDFLAGSPILVAALSKRPFDKYLLVDMNEKYCNSLEKRLTQFNIDSKIFCADCNHAIDEIIEQLAQNDHYLAFIDCESGFEIKWKTLMKLLSKPGDLIFNFQSVQVHRVVTQYQKNPDIDPQSLVNLYGDKRWKSYRSRDDCLNGYINKIKNESNREIVIPLHVTGPRGYYYDLVVATRKTGGGSPWMKPMVDLQDMFRKLEPKIVQTVIDVLKGRKKTLFDYN